MILHKLEERLGCSLGDLYPKTIPLQFQYWNRPFDFLELPDQSSPFGGIPFSPPTPAKSLIQCIHVAESIPGISYVSNRGDDILPCDCIHCFLKTTFPRNLVLKSVLVTSPLETCNKHPKVFNISMEEYQGVKSGSKRLSLFLLKHDADAGWFLVSNRTRIWLNGIDVNFIQVGISWF